MTNTLFVAWRSPEPNGPRWGPVGRLEHGPGGYRFVYTRGAMTLPDFQPFAEMPRLDAVYESDELFPLFANRLLSRSRPEYQAYLTWGGFDPNNPPDPIALLAVTQGRRATDQLELFPCPARDTEGGYLNKFFLHGIRHMSADAQSRVGSLRVGERLRAVPEDTNPSDPQAVAVFTEGDDVQIGYVPRYLAREVRDLFEQCGTMFAELQVERVNPSAPMQQKLLCRMSACWPEGFNPCTGGEFQPIVIGLGSALK
ncbi:MAG TPA: HIRAN domain-containing protein [Pirellulales bacterium]|jgi:hypothetical protein|nr:HIRAN domain-containing protein [Pirellulales bacterium]